MNALLRSLAFTLLFYTFTVMICLALLWTLILPRKVFLNTVKIWLRGVAWLERHVLGLKIRLCGWSNVPQGPCIIAAKHQSAWETLKLHLLFGDPAIVLKRELLSIPIWGWYLRKTGMIAIDRRGGPDVIQSMTDGVAKAVTEGRKIVIFPQGTRVRLDEVRPYKAGVGILYETLNLPVVPMALNSGFFWPKNGFWKKSGLVTVSFLPAIPSGLSRNEMMEELTAALEGESNRLLASIKT